MNNRIIFGGEPSTTGRNPIAMERANGPEPITVDALTRKRVVVTPNNSNHAREQPHKVSWRSDDIGPVTDPNAQRARTRPRPESVVFPRDPNIHCFEGSHKVSWPSDVV